MILSTKIRFSDLKGSERARIRGEIVEFCSEPRTLKEVEEKFNLNGISASAILTNLAINQLIELSGGKNTVYTKR
jgi:hypothetical protein